MVGRSGPSDTAKSPSDVRHYAHANYKFNDSGWFDDKRTHLWVAEVASGRAAQLTSGDDWNDSDPQWSPDSRKIAFVSDRTGKAFDMGHNTDVWVIDAAGGALTKISDHTSGDNSPRWSPDGQTIAFLSSVPEKSHPKIWLAPSSGGAPSRLAAEGVDLIPGGLRWAENGKALYFETGFKGTNQLFRVDLAARKAAAVSSGDRTVHLVDLNEKTNRLAYAVNDPTHLDDLYVADLHGGSEKQLTHLNAALWKQLQLSPVERVAFKGADGWDVDGFFMKPIGWEAGKKYPMILTIHGGPAGQFGFDWYHEFQVYAAHGWAVFFTNPRGSTGYGEKFERGIELNWGGKDYIDVMNGVDAALAKYPWIDKDRLGVTGGSYGGYLTNWIVSHTNRFKAAVTLRSISNFVSDDGTQGWRVWARGRLHRRHLRKARSLLERVPVEIRAEREDPDPGPPLRQRLPRANRAGRAVVPRAAALRRAERDRLFPAREPQPDAHRRAEASGREHQLAGLLVRALHQRQCGRRAARCSRAHDRDELAGSALIVER